MTRPGFTLLEVLVAIVLTSVVALLAYGTAQAGLDTRERLERYRDTAEARLIVRSFLLDALRHPPEGGGLAMNDTLVQVVDRMSGGLPVDELLFFSHGVMPPHGGSASWGVTLSPTAEGLRLHAVALDPDGAAPLDILLADVQGLNVRVLARTADTLWNDWWDAPGRVPAALSLEFLSERGTPVAPALIVHAALEVVR